MTRGQVAASVRRNKENHPERYCADPRCLWALRSGPCPKHKIGADSQLQRREKLTAEYEESV